MKKLYMLGLVLMAASLTGCTLKAPLIPELSTGDIQLATGTELTGMEVTGTELTGMTDTGILTGEPTGPIDAVVVPMAEGSEYIPVQKSGIITEVKELIEERNTQEKDEKKINEPDIDLMQKIIDLFK